MNEHTVEHWLAILALVILIGVVYYAVSAEPPVSALTPEQLSQLEAAKPKQPEVLMQQCPDHWIQDSVPRAYGYKVLELPRSYFVMAGERHEMWEFDMDWVRANCQVQPQNLF